MNAEQASTKKAVIVDSLFLECSTGTKKQLQQYAQMTGVSVASIVDEALNDWLTCVGPARQAAAQPRPQLVRRRG